MSKIIKSEPRLREWINPKGEKKTAWQIDWYYEGETKRRKKQFATKREAKLWEPNDGPITGEEITIKQAAEIWLKACRVGRKGRPAVEHTTDAHYERLVRLHINPLIGDKKLAEFKIEDVYEYRDMLLERLSRPHAKKVWTAFKSILSEAAARGKVSKNVAADEHIHVSKRDQKKIEVPEPEEVTRILATVEELATQQNRQLAKRWRRYRAMINMLAFTGIRLSELRGAPWPNFNAAEATFTVTQRADEFCRIGPPKSEAGYRTIALDKDLVRMLKEWQIECPPSKLKLMFPNFKGNVENRANIFNRCWKPLLQRAGVVDENGEPKYTPHCLRHFRASILIASGANHKEIQTEMGHSDIRVTYDIYGHLFKEDISARQDRANQIAAALRPKK